MSRHPSRVVLLALFLFTTATTLAADLAVPQQYGTIQAAIDAAQAGDTVLVAPGTYFENLRITRAVTLRSTASARNTIIDGQRTGAVIDARGTGSEMVRILGFTITNGYHAIGMAGGINLREVIGVVADNVIRDNIGCTGSGMASLLAAVTVERNRITENPQDPACDSADGGGIHMNGDGPAPTLIANNIISGHRIGGRGAGLGAQAMNRLTIRGNLITDNEANSPGGGTGGGIMILGGAALVTGNVLHNNSALEGGGAVLFADSDRIVFSGNVMGRNRAVLNGSGLMLVYTSAETLQVTSNVVNGNSLASLVYCSGGPFVVPASNRLQNSGGPELGGACEPELTR